MCRMIFQRKANLKMDVKMDSAVSHWYVLLVLSLYLVRSGRLLLYVKILLVILAVYVFLVLALVL